ncbi:DNA-directed RNA polymerase subunit beta' [Acidaminococcus fermentans]|uniref:DNA-directed RNA polymerase subunit beta' n=2 Tax=Acidaminococcus TaxID=904 RepID=A0A1H2X7I2_ACIFE|nr:DNA-directed RNA polymerase subunit beta' [Acidaminococcus fermentans]MCF0139309.1 DNA-directed RNA polymerase subunit beta' [Acidaminococcus fermentans]MDY4148067.1 DNA-directed RNA polymerase subunit beta' [Acidaminococcus fermentans]SDW88872.1 DNA-directed RNA polymerase subunit beta' [Acidaminococcus fermentans]
MLDVNKFHSMRIGLASPEKIRAWSHGEVTKPETINYRTLKPERDGLFCERIFGPTKDWECHCGKYKRIRYKGVVCDKCGVEVTRSKVRRDRMGSIELAAPVSHIWYFKGIPCRMGAILDIGQRALEKVLYFASYIVLDPGDTNLTKKQLLTEAEYQEKLDEYGPTFRVGMGAEAIKELLHEINVEELTKELRAALKTETSLQKRRNIVRRLDVCEAFLKSGNKPEWMIMDVIPVIPPDLRPMVQLDGGRFATSDLNDLYRRVINRNNRLKRLQELQAPDIIVRNEKRMLQEAVDALIDNGRRGRAVTGPGTRPLKSLSDMLKGKQGRFRQNLLGKRVDYSGRSVIVVGPEMKMHQCGLPKEMALELFKPFVMKRLVETGAATNIKSAKRMVERATNAVWDVLEDVIKEHPVLLNRAPTLHRLGIQAFEPILSEGRAIKLHPLVCTPYNADFDGDQMAVHLPLSAEAQAEARVLMMSVNNILAPKDGKPITVPTQDMVLGAYYLTIFKDGAKGEGRRFISFDEARLAYFNHVIDLQARIKVKVPNAEIFPEPSDQGESLVTTSMGNIIYNCELPVEMRYYSKQEDGTWLLGKLIDKKELGRLVAKAHKLYGNFGTARVLDIVKKLGYDNACKSGLSIAASDIKIPKEKASILAAAEKQVDKVETIFNRGLMSDDERYRKVIAIWDKATEDVANALMKHTMDPFNPVYMMANSGARGNVQQIRQLAGMRGLMADPSGRIIDRPIKSNFREGLTILEYFISSHGARKGLTDTALRTADSGYLTRRLVDVAQDVIVREDDCDVTGMNLVRERARFCKAVLGSSQHKLKDYAIGRTLAASVMDPEGDSILAEADTVVTEEVYDRLMAAHILEISLYPADEESGEEPETLAINVPEDKVKAAFREHMTHHFLDKQVEEDIVNEKDEVLAKAGDKFTADVIEKILEDGTVKELKIRNNEVDGVYVEAITSGKNKSTVLESLRDRLVGRTLAEDIADKDGKVIYHINDYITEDMADVIADLREKVKIRSVLTCKSHFGVCRACYGRNLATAKKVEVGEAVGTIAAQAIGEPGTQLTMRTFHTGGVAGADDITQGLPRVEELFEARKPKHPGILTEVAGTVDIQEKDEGRFVVIRKEDGTEESYHIPYGAKIHVAEGDKVEVGDRLTEGSLNPHDILRISGPAATRHYLVQQVLGVYKSQGVEINDKHVEVMVRQMMRKYKIDEAGDTNMLPGSVVDIAQFEDENDEVLAEGKQPATGHPILLGITKASLATDSFLSAASFQETTRNLTDAAIKGKVDPLLGLKENVIIGKLIPAGTGMPKYRNIQLKIHRPTEAAEEAPAVTSEAPAAEAPAAEAPVEE